MSWSNSTSPSGWRRVLLGVRNRHLALVDLLLLPMAAVLAFALRLDANQLQKFIPTMVVYALAAPLIQMPIFSVLGLYGRFWQFASTDELVLLGWAALIGGLAQGALFLGFQALFPGVLAPPVPRSIPLIATLVTFICIAGPRFALRLGAQNARRSIKEGAAVQPAQHVLIMGAGEAGTGILREIRANPQTGLIPVGFVDDDPNKRGVLIYRVRVLGGREAIPALVREHHVEQVIIAMPGAYGKTIREIASLCEAVGVRARVIPGMYELLGDTVHINQLRDVQIEDLLRREPVRTDTAQVEALLRGRRVLVTGAGGSIGSELSRQIARCDPAELVLLGHGENSVFEIHNELSVKLETQARGVGRQVSGPRRGSTEARVKQSAGAVPVLHPVIADIRFEDRLQHVLGQFRPEIVFHAAAHKHVPFMESNVEDAVSNNILGTKRLVDACMATGVTHFVLISTDKAVRPVSVMGATKRVAEMIVQEAARATGRCFVTVRFGNVLGSRGSVVPYFQKQIAAGGPITVTHPEMSRYFMTIPEAVQLVLQAAALGRGGELFVLDMGEPVRIFDLARDLIRLSGLEPDRDIEIRFTGLRPGEKLSEDLFGEHEIYNRSQHQKIFVCRDGREYSSSLRPNLQALVAAAENGDVNEARRLLHELIPEYHGTP
jgi:FlaA1/EpsC-like NDP-sugar epimerase